MKRIAWLDSCKAIAIFLVVLGHFSFINSDLKTVIYAFHLPLFLFISGYLFSFNQNNIYFKTKLNVLLYLRVFLFFSVLSIALWIAVEGPTITDIAKTILMNIYGTHGTERAFTHANGALWYLPFLTASIVLYSIVWKLPKVISFCVLIVLTYLSQTLEIRLPWSFDAAPVGTFFLLVGSTVKQYNWMEKIQVVPWQLRLLAACSLLSLCSALALYNSSVNINQRSFGDEVFLFYVVALFGVIAMVLASQLLKPSRLIVLVGENTLIIFCLHLFLVKAFRGVISSIDPSFRMYTIFVLALLITVFLAFFSKFVMPYFQQYVMRK